MGHPVCKLNTCANLHPRVSLQANMFDCIAYQIDIEPAYIKFHQFKTESTLKCILLLETFK